MSEEQDWGYRLQYSSASLFKDMGLDLDHLGNWGSTEIAELDGFVQSSREADRLREIHRSIGPRVLPYNIWHNPIFSVVDLAHESFPSVRFTYFFPSISFYGLPVEGSK